MSKCFVIMPITTPEDTLARYGDDDDHFRHVLDYLFIPAITMAGFEPVSPIAEGADLIHANIIANLDQAALVLCDMSCLNPNVFFELGIRTALDKPVCMVQDDASERVPFDTAIINFHKYNSDLSPWNLESEIESLVAHIQKSCADGQTSNSLWQYFGVSTRAHSLSETGGDDDRLNYLTRQVDALRSQLEKKDDTQEERRLGDIIRLERQRMGMTQQELANRAGYSVRSIARLEQGHANASRGLIECVAGALHLNMNELMKRNRD